MKITEEQVRYVADLANLHLTEDEVRKFQTDLDEILVHLDRLNEMDTSQCRCPWRRCFTKPKRPPRCGPIVRGPGLGTDLALANAPVAGSGYFKVPEVIKR